MDGTEGVLAAGAGRADKLPLIAEPLECLRLERASALNNLNEAQRILNRIRGHKTEPTGTAESREAQVRGVPTGIVSSFKDVAVDLSEINKKMAEILGAIGEIV